MGGLDFELTEGDVLAVFSQYGEIVDLNLVRDKTSGNSRGFAFIAYEDQRSTNLAVDNLSGAKVVGRVIRVEHVGNYKKQKAEVRIGVIQSDVWLPTVSRFSSMVFENTLQMEGGAEEEEPGIPCIERKTEENIPERTESGHPSKGQSIN